MDAYRPFRDRDCVDERLDGSPVDAEHEELAALAAELRALGRRTPRLGPSPEMRAAFRQAVLREAHRPRKRPFARVRGAVLGVAAIAGGGLLIASAASGPNPAMLVVDTVREIRVPVLQEAPRGTVPVGSQEARSAGPAPSDEPPMAMAEATPSAESGTRIPPATATPADDPAPPVALRPTEAADGSRASAPTPTPAHTARDTTPPRDAADSVAPAEPTPTPTETRPATSVSAAPTETKRETEPTAVAASPTPTPTPSPEPKPSDGAIVSDASGKLTPKEPTPAPTPTADPGPASDTPGETGPSLSDTETTKKEG